MSVHQAPIVNHSEWCQANRADNSSTTCVAIREETPREGQLAADGGMTAAVCQVCGVESRVR